jgi:outer membrane protein OmpA-like peptidoglycan-associated protein
MRFVVVVTMLALGSCVGPGIQAQADVTKDVIDKARKSGAYQCAPKELAMAESNVDFAENELAEGDFMRAREHMDIAVSNANAALANSKDCAPKRVLIKTKTDRDGDGIPDDIDKCPDEPEDKDGWQDADGCPDPDNDGDGVLDPLDKCPNTPGPKENDGCPYGDTDGDGVPDNQDECPTQPGPVENHGRPAVDEDKDGINDCVTNCPMTHPQMDKDGKPIVDKDGKPVCDECPTQAGPAYNHGCPDPDRDHDGIMNDVDACPDEPGPPETKGCPDRDHDGIADKDDKCPDVPGVPRPDKPELNGCPRGDKDGDRFFDDEDACPDEPGVSWKDHPEWLKKNPKGGDGCPPPLTLVVIKQCKIEIKQQPHFDTAKANIKADSAELLRQVATAIRTMQDIKKIVIEGHTDDQGGDDYNMGLSQDRANSVRLWLIDKEHLEPAVLESVGYGLTRPIASNRTSQGRAQNRRVEFRVVRQGCDDNGNPVPTDAAATP